MKNIPKQLRQWSRFGVQFLDTGLQNGNPGSERRDEMSATATGTTPQSGLSHGTAIEYKAFARSFTQDETVGVLYLIATCYYGTSGFTIFFEENSGKFNLMEQPPTGIFMNLVTYYVATWPTGGSPGERTLPTHVDIVDAQGEHRVHVKPWK
jgi:hypothetical protein